MNTSLSFFLLPPYNTRRFSRGSKILFGILDVDARVTTLYDHTPIPTRQLHHQPKTTLVHVNGCLDSSSIIIHTVFRCARSSRRIGVGRKSPSEGGCGICESPATLYNQLIHPSMGRLVEAAPTSAHATYIDRCSWQGKSTWTSPSSIPMR